MSKDIYTFDKAEEDLKRFHKEDKNHMYVKMVSIIEMEDMIEKLRKTYDND